MSNQLPGVLPLLVHWSIHAWQGCRWNMGRCLEQWSLDQADSAAGEGWAAGAVATGALGVEWLGPKHAHLGLQESCSVMLHLWLLQLLPFLLGWPGILLSTGHIMPLGSWTDLDNVLPLSLDPGEIM